MVLRLIWLRGDAAAGDEFVFVGALSGDLEGGFGEKAGEGLGFFFAEVRPGGGRDDAGAVDASL